MEPLDPLPAPVTSEADSPSRELRTSSRVGDAPDLTGDFMGDLSGDAAHVTIDGTSFTPIKRTITIAVLPILPCLPPPLPPLSDGGGIKGGLHTGLPVVY